MATNININQILFTRIRPQKKLELIEKMGPAELMNVSYSTIERIVKETGSGKPRCRNKRLYICRDRQKGNSWNSTIEAIDTYKGKMYLDVYMQYENTDGNTDYAVSSFLQRGESRIGLKTTDRYGNDRTYYAIYDEGDKQRVIRSILEEYVHTKYSDKLCVKN